MELNGGLNVLGGKALSMFQELAISSHRCNECCQSKREKKVIRARVRAYHCIAIRSKPYKVRL